MSPDNHKKKRNDTPNLESIAERAGVGKMTVSRALRGVGYVSAEKRERILRIAQEMGYRRSNIVSTVMSQIAGSRSVKQATPLVLLFDSIPSESPGLNDAIESVKSGAQRRAEQLGFPLEVIFLNRNKMKDQRLDTILETKNIQGIVINVTRPYKQTIELSWERLVAVTMGGALSCPQSLPNVHGDYNRMMSQAFEELEARGYKRVGYIGQRMTKDLLNSSYASVLLYHSVTPRRNQVNILSDPEGDEQILNWYRKEKPDSIICNHAEPVRVLREAGIEAPRDYGFICLGLKPFSPEIAGIYFEKSLLAEAAVDIVVKNLMTGNIGIPKVPSRVLLQGEWYEGSTLRERLEEE